VKAHSSFSTAVTAAGMRAKMHTVWLAGDCSIYVKVPIYLFLLFIEVLIPASFATVPCKEYHHDDWKELLLSQVDNRIGEVAVKYTDAGGSCREPPKCVLDLLCKDLITDANLIESDAVLRRILVDAFLISYHLDSDEFHPHDRVVASYLEEHCPYDSHNKFTLNLHVHTLPLEIGA